MRDVSGYFDDMTLWCFLRENPLSAIGNSALADFLAAIFRFLPRAGN